MTDPAPDPQPDEDLVARSDEAWIAPPESVPPISAEDLVDGDHPDEGPQERRYPSTIGGAFYLGVLAVTFAGLVVVATGDWRVGIRIMGGTLIVASAVRVLLPPRDAGMLAVRNKALDMVLLAGLGAALIFLSTSIPDQPGF